MQLNHDHLSLICLIRVMGGGISRSDNLSTDADSCQLHPHQNTIGDEINPDEAVNDAVA